MSADYATIFRRQHRPYMMERKKCLSFKPVRGKKPPVPYGECALCAIDTHCKNSNYYMSVIESYISCSAFGEVKPPPLPPSTANIKNIFLLYILYINLMTLIINICPKTESTYYLIIFTFKKKI